MKVRPRNPLKDRSLQSLVSEWIISTSTSYRSTKSKKLLWQIRFLLVSVKIFPKNVEFIDTEVNKGNASLTKNAQFPAKYIWVTITIMLFFMRQWLSLEASRGGQTEPPPPPPPPSRRKSCVGACLLHLKPCNKITIF